MYRCCGWSWLAVTLPVAVVAAAVAGIVTADWLHSANAPEPQKKTAAAKDRVLAVLGSTKRTVAVRVGDHDDALDLLDSVWDWLFEHRSGLLQADGEGFYEDDLHARNRFRMRGQCFDGSPIGAGFIFFIDVDRLLHTTT